LIESLLEKAPIQMKTRLATIEDIIGTKFPIRAELGLSYGDKVVTEYDMTTDSAIAVRTTKFLERKPIFKFVEYDMFDSTEYDAFVWTGFHSGR